ncbi:MAG: efflux RND transporter periplasmic adaptor subunit [Desulfomonilaceae bacterium]
MQGYAKLFVILLAGCFLYGLSACRNEPVKKTAEPPSVTVSLPVQADAQKHLEYTGSTAALESVDIRARVAGFLEKVSFEPQQNVKKGDLLFVIDPRQYEAAVKKASAQLESTQATLKLAQIDEQIAKTLQSKDAISWLKLQEATAKSSVSTADVNLADANLEEAKLNLEYTQVISPIDGIVGRNLVDVGNLVGATEKTLLTTVVNDASIYCYFNVSALDLLSLKRHYQKGGNRQPVKFMQIPVLLGLEDEDGFPHKGNIDFTDNVVNQSTGTMQFRAIFPNTDGFLLPGMFARIRIPLKKSSSLLIPEVAIQSDQGGRYVLVVDNQDVVQQKRIKMGQEEEGMRVIKEGITPEDRVIVSGIQRARPGSKVNPTVSRPATPGPSSEPEEKPQQK